VKVSIKPIVSLCATYLFATGLAMADSAVVIDGNNCGLFLEGGGTTSGEGLKVTTNSSNGNITITCSQKLPPTDAGRSVIFNYDNTGRECSVSGFLTKDWHQVISRSGNAKLTCHYHD